MANFSVTSTLKITFQAFTVAPAAAPSPFVGFGSFTQPAAGPTASAAPAAAVPLFSFASLAPVAPATPSTAFGFGTAAAAPAAGGLFRAAPAAAPAAPTTTFSFGAAATAPAAGGLCCSSYDFNFGAASLPLYVASQNGDLGEVVALLERGADVAAVNRTVILLALISRGSYGLSCFLISLAIFFVLRLCVVAVGLDGSARRVD